MWRKNLEPKTAHIFRTLVAFTILLAFAPQAKAGDIHNTHIPRNLYNISGTDTLPYPLRDRYGDPYTNPNRNTFDLRDTAFIKRNVEYDPRNKANIILLKR